jgi:uncharacterized protein
VSERLIIFTRYPEPGKAKTRLIPSLGAEAAADLHRQMTESTLAQVNQWQQSRSPQTSPATVEVWFAGGGYAQMHAWLGESLHYQPQPAGDLGERLIQALQAAFAAGAKATIIIGSDCPALTADILAQAFYALEQADLVLGPATDGGYYLIGLRAFVPELFESIAWSTERVFAQTLEIANRLGLSIACLPTLTDIDRPEDLVIWQRLSGLDNKR